jgi:asparagine synthase (glutamine-hydrolysing)
MCGFVGVLSSALLKESTLLKMTRTLTHRGPDESNIWQDHVSGISFGHQRLSILELSNAGSQPMFSANGRFALVYNGEFYNHLACRKGLAESGFAVSWKGSSDTETLIEMISALGLEKTLKLTTGMFSLALWDKVEKKLFLARDRFGEKPLYYGWQGESFLFGSELKALKIHPQFLNEIDSNALGLYFQYNYVPTPLSIYKGISKLTPGSILSVSLENTSVCINTYWSGIDTMISGKKNPFRGNVTEAIDETENVLKRAVQSQLLADVPLGAFLSGGIDSSLIVSLMSAVSNSPINTFTIGFDENGFNEAVFANKIASHLGTNHTELYINPKDCFDVIPLLGSIYDEPFADSSQIPTYLVSKLAAGSVKVALSGDGGDELFGGYNRYFFAEKLWNGLRFIPKPFRSGLYSSIKKLNAQQWDVLSSTLHYVLPEKYQFSNLTDKLKKASSLLAVESFDDVYFRLVKQWENPGEILNFDFNPQKNKLIGSDLFQDNMDKMMLNDLLTYLPDDILCKVDRAGMAVSLESRIPFLDHNVFAFSSSLPLSFKINKGKSKWILREILKKYIPENLINRPKMGFGIPLEAWLRGPLKEWADDLLNEKAIKESGMLNPKGVKQKWEEHISGKRNWHYQLWAILMFQAWFKENF